MNIIYFTTSQNNSDYNEFRKLWKVKPNPSNQNFHNKLIRALSLTHHVDVISLRPYSRKLVKSKGLEKTENIQTNIHWHYLKVEKNKVGRLVSYMRNSLRICKELPQKSIIFTDCINPSVITCATYVAKKLGMKSIGVCTDSPSNISGTKKSFTLYLLKNAHKLSGYISLTEELNEMFNDKDAPHIVFEGIVDDFDYKETKIASGKYLFFGGALLERYGVYNLIKAYKNSDHKDIQLLICGHHANNIKLIESIGSDSNIKYLETLPIEEVIALERHAIACINPRPSSEDLERYSIPSKTLEYLHNGAVTISVKNNKLGKIFYENIVWAKTGSVDDLTIAINKVLSMSQPQREKMGKEAKEKVDALYSLKAINEKVEKLIRLFY